jgi:archaeal cell division control protein 6
MQIFYLQIEPYIYTSLDNMMDIEEPSLTELFKNERILDPRYVPDVLQCRDDEIERLNRILVKRINGNIVPKHVMIVGPTGSGKTVCVKHVLKAVKDKKGLLCSYLVADTSIYQILKTIANNFGIETSNRLINTNEYWTKIEERVKDSIAVIILDEIDKMLIKNRKEVYDLIYKFTRDPHVCLIGITNNYDIDTLITDARDRSSYNHVDVPFPPYDATQLRDILEYRVEQAFYPNALSDEVIPLCAALAAQRNGDARYALDLLSTAADLCEEDSRTAVAEDDVRRAERLAEVSLLRREVMRLSPHQKVLLECVYSNEEKQSPTEIYRQFNHIMRLTGREQVSHKTLSELVSELELYGYVEVERKGRGRGKGVTFYISPTGSVERKALLDALKDLV